MAMPGQGKGAVGHRLGFRFCLTWGSVCHSVTGPPGFPPSMSMALMWGLVWPGKGEGGWIKGIALLWACCGAQVRRKMVWPWLTVPGKKGLWIFTGQSDMVIITG